MTPLLTLAPAESGPQSSGEGHDTVLLIAGRKKEKEENENEEHSTFLFSRDALMSPAWKFP